MRVPRVLWIAVASVCAGACGTDPTLAIEVHHPAGSPVASTAITVYDSPTLTCDAVRFADVDATELAGLVVAEETLFETAPPQGNLDGIPRVDHKVIVARGLAADGTLATGGCVEQGEVTGALTLTIDTEAAVLASIASGSDAYGVQLTVAGLAGAAVAGRAVSWRVIGPAGTKPADASRALVLGGADATWDRPTTTCTDASGAATLHPVPPDLTGGYAARIRVAWAQDPPPPFTALTHMTPGERAVSPPAELAHPCAVGHRASSTPARVVACADTSSIDVFSVAVSGGVVAYTTVAGPAVTTAAGLYAVPDGSDVDLIAVDGGGNLPASGKLVPVYGTAAVTPCAECGTFVDAMYVPACGAQPAFLIGRTASNNLRQMAPLGGPAAKYPAPDPGGQDIALVGAGCVTKLDTAAGTSSQVQVVVLDYVFKLIGRVATTRAIFGCDADACLSTELPVAGAGVGFTGGATPSAVIASVDATGVVLSAVDLVQTGSSATFLEVTRLAAAAVPHRIAAGQLDADGQLDFVWDNVTKTAPILQVAYARPGFDGDLSAITGVAVADGSATVVDVQAGPTVAAAHDDAVIVTSTSVLVLPTLVPAETGTIPADPAPSPACGSDEM